MSLSSYLKRAEVAEEIFTKHTGKIFLELEKTLARKDFARSAPPSRKAITVQHGTIPGIVIGFELKKDVDLFLKVFLNGEEEGAILLDLADGNLKYYVSNNECSSLEDAIDYIFSRY